MPSTVADATVSSTSSAATRHVVPAAWWVLALGTAHAVLVGLVLPGWLATSHPSMTTFAPLLVPASLTGFAIGWYAGARHRALTTPARWWPLVTFAVVVAAGTAFPDSSPDALIVPAYVAGTAAVLAGCGRLAAGAWASAPARSGRWPFAGVVAGLVVVAALQLASGPPIVWVILAVLGYLAMSSQHPSGSTSGPTNASLPLLAIGLLCVPVLAVGAASMADDTGWSAYSRVSSAPQLDGTSKVSVNGAARREVRDPVSYQERYPLTAAPYTQADNRGTDRALVLGAGTGNEPALALGRGYARVDAVELDQGLSALGARRHPDQPYTDERNNLQTSEGRAFLRRTGYRYDLVVIAVPGPRNANGSANVADATASFLTEENLAKAREVLTPNGVLAVRYPYPNAGSDPVLAAMNDAMGHPPCVMSDPKDAWLRGRSAVATVNPDDQRCAEGSTSAADSPALRDFWATMPASSNHRWFGAGVLALLAVGAGLSVLRLRSTAEPTRSGPSGATRIALLGGAFALLTGSAYAIASLVYGAAWPVILIVLGVVAIVAAVASTTPMRRAPAWSLAGAAVIGAALQAAMSTERLAALPSSVRLLVIVVCWGLPLLAVAALAVRALPPERSESHAERGFGRWRGLSWAGLGAAAATVLLAFGFGLGGVPPEVGGLPLGWPAVAVLAVGCAAAAALLRRHRTQRS